MAKHFTGHIEQVDANRWRIPKSSQSGMRVDGIIYASEALIDDVIAGGGPVQVANVATLPGIVKASMAMPDIHWGYGFPIGGVAATDVEEGGVVSPGGVGYDINCGVRLMRTDVLAADVRGRMRGLVDQLFSTVPVGVGVGGPHKFSEGELDRIFAEGSGFLVRKGLADEADVEVTESRGCLPGADPGAVSAEAHRRGRDQCGTLGSGNHFLEVQVVDELFDAHTANVFGLFEGQLTVLIHTGSRGLGHQVCQDAIKTLRGVPGALGIELPDRQLVCAPVESDHGRRYMGGMASAANFAWANRQLLAGMVRDCLAEYLGGSPQELGIRQVYDVAHNVARIETHEVDGRKRRLCVHRKGATRALPPGHEDIPEPYRAAGQPVLIPGDMGTASYVLSGTPEAMAASFASTCHGAGRVMSRKEAVRQAKGRSIEKELSARGVLARARGRQGLAEEQPAAYKDIDAVIECVADAGLSRKVARLKPLAVVKG